VINGETAVSYACRKGQTSVLALLLKHGAPYEEEQERTVRHRLVNKQGLWPKTHSCMRSLLPAVEKHITRHKEYRENNSALAALLKAHKTSFVVKGFFAESFV
jgi:ankyrin repeat protein